MLGHGLRGAAGVQMVTVKVNTVKIKFMKSL